VIDADPGYIISMVYPLLVRGDGRYRFVIDIDTLALERRRGLTCGAR
jgi:hypothetical protein